MPSPAAAPADAGLGFSAEPFDAGPPLTLVTVHYPTAPGHALALRGSGGALSWDRGVAMRFVQAGVWTLALPLTSPTELKPLFDDVSWAIGPNWTVTPGQPAELWPHFFTQAGSLQRYPDWGSVKLGNSRGVWIYTPPSYAENDLERFPVAYFQDGQNLFVDQASASGVSWNLGGAMDQGALDGTIHEAIVIGIENSPARIYEYTPTNGGLDGGGADRYLAFVADELKPQIDATLRTAPDRDHTVIAGSSLGGLLAAYAGVARPEIFGLIGALSPSSWWDDRYIVTAVGAATHAPQPVRVYLDSGDAGYENDDEADTALLAAAYLQAGVPLDYLVAAGGEHSERYWRARVPGALTYLLGPR